MIKEYTSIAELPSEIHVSLQNNMFFSDEYGSCVAAEGRTRFLLASDKYIIPFVFTRKWFFKYGFFAFQPICIDDSAEQSVKEFLDQVIAFLSQKKHVHFLNPTPAYTCFKDYPTKSKRIPFGNYVCDLSVSEEEMFEKLHSKHRNSVRKAKKDGIIVKSGRDKTLLAHYMQMDVQTEQRSKKPSEGISFYRTRLNALPQHSMIFIAYKDDIPQSGALIYYDKLCGYYMFGANKNSPHSGSGNLLQWEIMRWLKSKGVSRYSFVGCRINEDEDSKYHNIQRFKARFGGELIQGYMFKCVCNTTMHNIFRCFMHIRGASNGDAVDQELDKWKDLN